MGMTELMQLAANVEQRSLATRAEKKQKHKNTSSSWRRYWEDAIRKTYPEVLIGFTIKDIANLKQAANRGLPLEDIGPMLEWAVVNWQTVRTLASFGNKAIGPEVPCLRFLIWSISHVHSAYVRNRDSATIDLTTRHRPARTEATPAPVKALKPATPLPMPAKQPAPLRIKPRPAGSSEQARIQLGLRQWKGRTHD